MKITKRQLRRIIKEEQASLLEMEDRYVENDRLLDTAQDQIEQIVSDLHDKGIVDNDELIALLQRVIEDLERGFVGAP
tara:strand:+ start:470 stop:703 length:234 start_codon:yes stop_codon:yes gene_type:complete